MRRFNGWPILFVWMACSAAQTVHAQGDWAVYDTFTRYSPAVYSIEVEIPKDHALDRYEEVIRQFRDLHENYSGLVSNTSEALAGHELFTNLMDQWKRKLDIIKNQMLSNKPLQGAGFAVGEHYIVTLSTVVKSATLGGIVTIKDDFNRGTRAELRGFDEMTGIAVLEVKDVTFSHYIDLNHISGQLPVASYIMTIQRPYDLPASPFSGMIGGYYRRFNIFKLERYIQTDLPVYPKNEGAPVFSPSGHLVGMVAAEFHIGRWPGVTLVIPADIVVDTAREIIQHGKRERGFIPGLVLGQDIDGVRIQDLDPKSPTVQAGLLKGDIIVALNGKKETKLWNLYYRILNTKPGETVQLEVQRGSQILRVNVQTTLAKLK